MDVDPRSIRSDSPMDVVAALCGCERYQLECYGNFGPYTTRLIGIEECNISGLNRAMFESRGSSPADYPMYASTLVPIVDAREAYETLAARGIIPCAAVEDPTRRFTDSKVPLYCKCGGGNGFNCNDDLSGVPVSHTCTACGYAYWRGRSLSSPPSVPAIRPRRRRLYLAALERHLACRIASARDRCSASDVWRQSHGTRNLGC